MCALSQSCIQCKTKTIDMTHEQNLFHVVEPHPLTFPLLRIDRCKIFSDYSFEMFHCFDLNFFFSRENGFITWEIHDISGEILVVRKNCIEINAMNNVFALHLFFSTEKHR